MFSHSYIILFSGCSNIPLILCPCVLSNKVGISQTREMALDAKGPKGMKYLLNKVAPMPPCLLKVLTSSPNNVRLELNLSSFTG